MMSQTALAVLKRMPPQVEIAEITDASFWGDLPEKAQNILGYGELKKKKDHLDLRGVLDTLDARPFTSESVESYKNEICKETHPRYWFIKRAHRTIEYIILFIAVVCFGPTLLGWLVSWNIWAAFTVPLLISLGIIGYMENNQIKYPGEWIVLPLRGFLMPVPEYVLYKALEIKEMLPKAEFHVHGFVQEKKVIDPFLAVRYGDEEYFIAVWDEPKFEAKQKV